MFYDALQRETGREKNTELLLHFFMHSLVDSFMCPDQGLNPQPWNMGQCSSHITCHLVKCHLSPYLHGHHSYFLEYHLSDYFLVFLFFSPILTPPSPLANVSLFSVSMSLHLFCIVYSFVLVSSESTFKGNHMVLVFLCLTYFT